MRHCLMKRYFHIAIISFACCLAAACGDNTPVVELTQDNSTLVKENMINANRVVIQSEATQIESYVNRRGWEMKPLPCGALYWQTVSGQGPAINPEDTVVVTYRLEALDGTPFYTNQRDTLVVGRRHVTVALDDILQQLHYGSQAWMIAPSNAAYGVVGDGDRVPSRTVIVYNIKDIQKSKKVPSKGKSTSMGLLGENK
ncbi:MAG: FKBP-type peptidyl-prolyl cis-trans isomerase [Bacteroidales bacterium]|nr:FKBP-type peptidyl-prolyl cis-trans isomerase [Bacteroidales bacterium]